MPLNSFSPQCQVRLQQKVNTHWSHTLLLLIVSEVVDVEKNYILYTCAKNLGAPVLPRLDGDDGGVHGGGSTVGHIHTWHLDIRLLWCNDVRVFQKEYCAVQHFRSVCYRACHCWVVHGRYWPSVWRRWVLSLMRDGHCWCCVSQITKGTYNEVMVCHFWRLHLLWHILLDGQPKTSYIDMWTEWIVFGCSSIVLNAFRAFVPKTWLEDSIRRNLARWVCKMKSILIAFICPISNVHWVSIVFKHISKWMLCRFGTAISRNSRGCVSEAFKFLKNVYTLKFLPYLELHLPQHLHRTNFIRLRGVSPTQGH